MDHTWAMLQNWNHRAVSWHAWFMHEQCSGSQFGLVSSVAGTRMWFLSFVVFPVWLNHGSARLGLVRHVLATWGRIMVAGTLSIRLGLSHGSGAESWRG